MKYLVQGLTTLEFSVEVQALNNNEAKLIGEMLAESPIKNGEILVITSRGIPVRLKIHNNWSDEINAIEINEEKENHQTKAIA